MINKDETSATSEDNSSIAVAKSVISAVITRNKNEIYVLSLNEFLLSLVGYRLRQMTTKNGAKTWRLYR
jgi:hypothetical protein